MNVLRIIVAIVACSLSLDCGQCQLPLIPLGVGSISSVIGWGYKSVCYFKECCTDEYIPANLDLLRSSPKPELHGQHLAFEIVLHALEDHINAVESKRALALSFHGSSGTGKNHLVDLIVRALYKNGAKSNFVHFYNGLLDFPSEKKIVEYQGHLHEDIKKHLQSCPRSIFIFDKVDHIPEGTLDALAPFLDYNPRLIGVNPTRAIFIFISNMGAALIEKHAIQIWQVGKKRIEIKLENIKPLLVSSAFDGKGGFHNSDIIELNLINHYVPFLPLEKAQVKKCIKDAFQNRNFEATLEMIEEVMMHMTFEPSPHNIFSKSGCKLVNSKVSAVIDLAYHTNSENIYNSPDS